MLSGSLPSMETYIRLIPERRDRRFQLSMAAPDRLLFAMRSCHNGKTARVENDFVNPGPFETRISGY